MKKWLSVALALTAAFALAAAPFALAGNGHGTVKVHGAKRTTNHPVKGKSKFQCEAVVVSVDAASGSLLVTVKSGSRTVKDYRGQQLVVQVAPDARLIDGTADEAADPTGDGAPAPLTLDMLVAGAKVHLGGVIDRTDPAAPVFVAHKVILQKLPAVAPTPAPTPTPTDTAKPTPEPTATDTVTPTPDPTATDTPPAPYGG